MSILLGIYGISGSIKLKTIDLVRGRLEMSHMYNSSLSIHKTLSPEDCSNYLAPELYLHISTRL